MELAGHDRSSTDGPYPWLLTWLVAVLVVWLLASTAGKLIADSTNLRVGPGARPPAAEASSGASETGTSHPILVKTDQ